MRTAIALWAVCALGLVSYAGEGPVSSSSSTPSAQTALQWIKYGNERHVAGRYVHWHQNAERRAELAAGQHPHTIVLACSDSRVPPEILFDQGLGDLFVIRVAGNGVGDHELASIEYAAEHLGTPLVVVLGHQRCGAVSAAVKGGDMPGHLGSLMAGLNPAVARARDIPGDRVDNTVNMQVLMTVEAVRSSEPVLSHLVQSGKVEVVGAYYSLDTGEVRWMSPSTSVRHDSPALTH